MKKRLALIGLGKQNTKDHLHAIQKCDNAEVVAVCDTNKDLSEQWGKELSLPSFTSVDDLINGVAFDAAVIAVPHAFYLPIIKKLAAKNISILKEKPFALSLNEALEIYDIVEKSGINLTIAVQRKFSRIYQTYKEYEPAIGDIFSVHGHYTLDIKHLDEGWRASKKLAGGGAVLDMGYHLIDLLVWYFGIPDTISADLGYHNRPNQVYDVEDTAKIQFSYEASKGRSVLGSLLISRVYPEKEEALTIYGTEGSIAIYTDRITHYSPDKEILDSTYMKKNGDDMIQQTQKFIDSLHDKKHAGNYREHLADMVFVEAVYRSADTRQTVLPHKSAVFKRAIELANLQRVIKP